MTLHLVDSLDDLASREAAKAARAARIDALTVDRSYVRTAKALPHTPPEAEQAEEVLRPIRLAATMADKMKAYRAFFQKGR